MQCKKIFLGKIFLNLQFSLLEESLISFYLVEKLIKFEVSVKAFDFYDFQGSIGLLDNLS